MKILWVMVLALALLAALLFIARTGGQGLDREELAVLTPNASPQALSTPPPASAVDLLTEPESPSERNPVAPFAPVPPSIEPAHDGIRLYGFVRAGNGDEALVPAVNLVITDRLGEVKRTSVDAACAYSITGLAPGRHWIVCGAGEWGRVQRAIDLDAAETDRRFDVQLEFGSELRVEVVDRSGAPIPELPLFAVATLEAPGEWLDDTPDRASGTVGPGRWIAERRLADSEPTAVFGQLQLRISPPLFVSLVHHQRVVATKKVEPGAKSVRFVLDRDEPLLQRGSFRLRMIDAQSREPLPEISIEIDSQPDMTVGKTNSLGILRGPARPGWLGLRVVHKDYERGEFVARVNAGVETDLGDIALESAVSVAGQVFDEKGLGASGLFITAAVESPLPFRAGSLRGVASETGSFRIGGLSRRRYLLTVRQENEPGAQIFVADLRAGSLENLRLELVRGPPLIVSASDDRWPLVRFDVFTDQGVRLLSSRLAAPEPRKILLPRGRYEIEVRVGESIEGVRREITILNDPVELSLP